MTETLRTHFRTTPIEQETEPFRLALRTLPARLRLGPGTVRPPRTPIYFAAFMGLLLVAILGSRFASGLAASELLGLGVIGLVGIALVAPWGLRQIKGVSRWQRTVTLYKDRVEVEDRDATGAARWSQPLGAYRLCHEITRKGGFGGGTAPQMAKYDMLILRHADRSRDIPLRITPVTGTGGMTMHDMIDAGRRGDRAAVEAAVGNRNSPDFEAFKDYLSTLLDMTVVDNRPA